MASSDKELRTLAEGLYEALLTRDRASLVAAAQEFTEHREELQPESAPHVLARHVHDLILKALRNLKGDESVAAQVELTNEIIALLALRSPGAGIEQGDGVSGPAELLLSLFRRDRIRLGEGQVERPTLPLRQSDLIVNGPRDIRLGPELRHELASADRVDLLVSFLKWSGLRVVRQSLAEFVQRKSGQLRVLTTTYLGATDVEALDALEDMGADVRVSYDRRRTRLHAKAWLFHRDSGFSTGFIGSSNLSHSALLDGCEWNVRLSAVDNRPILAKFQTTFDQYWGEDTFEPYDRERFLAETERRDPQRDALARAIQLRPYPQQQEVLDALEHERSHGHTRNLVVAATGTGKTVVAALDYARLRREHGDLSLLFVAHRREILEQSQATFRAALRDGSFGERLVGGDKPTRGKHVFASIQALHSKRLEQIAPNAYDVVIVDEFHHAEAPTYRALLEHLEPKILLGLTATPERADGKSILEWFDHRIAAETRLWDALDLGLLVPFQYFGVWDGTDLSMVDWRNGRYDIASLERVYTADEIRARAVLRAVDERIRSPNQMKALGFCVSVKHARFMAEVFRSKGVPAIAVTGETPKAERSEALRRLRGGEVNVLFTVDLFNEGVDIPSVDTVLMLRPTESATIFLQQLGRGLRLADDKECLTVLDFIGRARPEFRFDQRFRALVGGTRASVLRVVEKGFPHLPAGTEIQLDRESQEAVLSNLRAALKSGRRGLVEDLRALGDVRLGEFLAKTEVELDELYRSGRTFTELKHLAGIRRGQAPKNEVSRALSRLLHVDDDDRLLGWCDWLSADQPPEANPNDPLQLMLFALLGHVRRPVAELSSAFKELWAMDDLREEVHDLFSELAQRNRKQTYADPAVPFRHHAVYSRDEISAGLRQIRKGKLLRTQSGVYKDETIRSDLFYVTLEKDESQFTPTTLYEDYPISPTRFHWESQSVTRADSATGKRYQNHESMDWRILLFVRRSKKDDRGMTMPYTFLGSVRYVEHESEKPMRIVWELERAMPPSFFREAKIAAG